MIDFSKYDDKLDMKKVEEQMKSAAEGSFDPLPEGEYDVKLDSMTVKESQNGRLMLAVAYRITRGKEKNKMMFQNIILAGTKNDGFMIHQARKLIDDLGYDAPEFSGYAQFADEIDEIAEDAVGEEYVIELSYNGQYPRYNIKQN